MVKQLVARIDRNQDGRITNSEFGDFLTTLLQTGSEGRGASGAARTAHLATTLATLADRSDAPDPPDPADPAEPPAAELPPSTWTDNNAPYGVTFAGFSPQNHRDLTLDDLGIPGKAEKYAVYHYLLTNKVQPTKDWAPAAAEALNKRYNTSVFKVIDGETLGYGNEYIHSAPNGYGMARGTFNPDATGEFFWGTTKA